MKIRVIFETKELEKVRNAFLFRCSGKKLGQYVKVFLIGGIFSIYVMKITQVAKTRP